MGINLKNLVAKATKKPRIHYAWVILIAGCVLSVVSRADTASFGVFIDPLVAEHGWSHGAVSLAYSMAFIAGLPAVVGMGWLGDRYGTRLPMLIASLVIGTGTVLLGTITELWQFYVYYALFVGSLGNAAFTVLLPVILTKWFHRRVGIAIGLYWASMGVGPLVFAPLFRYLVDTQGWRWTFFTMGIIVGGLLVLFSQFIRGSPKEKGLTAYGEENSSHEAEAPAVAATPRIPLKSLLAKPAVWYLMAIHHLGCVGHAVILAHVVSMGTRQGMPGVQAAGILSTIAGFSIVSRFVFSVLTERLGARRLLTAVLIAQGTSVAILLWAHDPWVFYAFAVVFGLSYGGEMVGFPIINRRLFGAEAPLNSIYSLETVGASTGMALGGWLGGMLFDLTDTYQWSLIVSMIASYVGLPVALALPRHTRKPVPQLQTSAVTPGKTTGKG